MSVGTFAFGASYPGSVAAVDLATAVAKAITTSELGTVVGYRVSDSPGDKMVSGSLDDLLTGLKRPTPSGKKGNFEIATSSGFDFVFSRSSEKPNWWVYYFDRKLDAPQLLLMGRFAEALFRSELPCTYVQLERTEKSLAFVPKPPIAGHRHIVVTDEDEVARSYDDPALFWRQWTPVHESGPRRLCMRALDSNETAKYLGRTFAGTMALARNAKPGLTEYGIPLKYDRNLREFWEPGPFSEEKAGLPALTFVGHDPKTDLYEYTGYIERNNDEHGHVLAKELCDLNEIYYSKEDGKGGLVAGRVHVVFLEEWMARQERRPLRDVGARVFFLGRAGEPVEVSD